MRITLAGPVHRVRNATSTGAALYESASQTRRLSTWRAPTSSPNLAVIPHLTTLRDRSRAATRNDGYAKGAIDELVTNLVGTGIKPLSQATDPTFRQRLQALWNLWTDASDADGLLDFYGQQTQAVRCWLEGGECFVRLRPRLPSDGLPVPLQIQVLEPELCPHHHSVITPTGGRVRNGIEYDGLGRRIAFWFHPSRPDHPEDYDSGQLRRVPADAVVHLYDPLRAGQRRGLPHLTQALVTLYELDKYRDATLLRQQLSNLFVAFLTRNPNAAAMSETVHPLTGQTVDVTAGERPGLSLEPGIFQELDAGEGVTFSDPPETRGFKEFMRQQLYAVAAATGVPYEVFTGDLSGLNDRVVRVILHKFRRRLLAYQHQIIAFQLCRRVWTAWMDRVFLSGALPIPAAYVIDSPEPWAKVRWMPQGWPYLHPVQDVDAQERAIRDGFTSRSAVVSEHGDDAEAIDAEQAADNARADELGLKYDSDGRRSRTGTTQPAASTQQRDAEERDPEEAGALA